MLTAEKGTLHLNRLLYFLLPKGYNNSSLAAASSSNSVLLCNWKRESSALAALQGGRDYTDKQEGKLGMCFN